ncbi:WD40 repeat-like protein [Punctularia strigosozonata HHB-11173 SS5]|uniref:WD40 repeat-like protein n=1 Tax=Punctularia strigosozonata (strain HHB-11173) TaxID=741275 RepID=UPI000441753F|nr:WD40 repeat-like protein [Punctularia strigosozonata HHB-11173 SS5]EIN12264.1 WD40 repeat-like protein [Punctularia strigosozonata HHB-11173 SS5]
MPVGNTLRKLLCCSDTHTQEDTPIDIGPVRDKAPALEQPEPSRTVHASESEAEVSASEGGLNTVDATKPNEGTVDLQDSTTTTGQDSKRRGSQDAASGQQESSYHDEGIVDPAKRLSLELSLGRQTFDDAKNAASDMGLVNPALGKVTTAVDGLQKATPTASSLAQTWSPLFERLRKFTELVDKIAEVHPYANMAWTVLSAVQRGIIAQMELDQSVKSLLDTLAATYDFMDEAQPLARHGVEPATKLLLALAQQTIECGYFIRDYTSQKNFVPRMVTNALKVVAHPSDTASAKVDAYKAKFAEIKSRLLEGSTIRTEILVNTVLNTVEEIAVEARMAPLVQACAKGSRFNREKICLPGTRRAVLKMICDWINDPMDSHRLLVLSGPAGSGKSAIAHTIALMFHLLRRLGASYCFDRSKAELTSASPVFPTIARDLSECDPQIRRTLSHAISQGSALVGSDSLAEQFEQFIVNPAKQLAISGPVVIVIDALDECMDLDRSRLLSILASKKDEHALPSNFRILVTCRSEPDITDTLRRAPLDLINVQSMEDVMKESANDEDIREYVRDELSKSSGEPSNLKADPKDLEEKCAVIAGSAEGLFQWAATACRFLASRNSGMTTKQRLRIISRDKTTDTNKGPLDELYLRVLRATFRPDAPEAMKNFRQVMSLLLAAKEPLSISDLRDVLWGPGNDIDLDPEAIEVVLTCMGALLSGTDHFQTIVRPFHTSFRDFLLHHERSEEFVITLGGNEHRMFLRGTIGLLLSEKLHFNMCRLETSYRLNTDYPDLEERVRTNIPSSLIYSARYWADHLEEMAYNSDLLQMAERLLKDKFLFWLELLSLLGSVPTCAWALLKLEQWTPRAGLFDTAEGLETVSIIEDFLKFIRAFGVVIGSSAPHIYLSAIPFAPTRSQVRRLYESKLPGRAVVVCGGSSEWPALECTMDCNGGILCAEFSDDGKHIFFVSDGSLCCTIHVRDAATGQPARRPVRCDTDSYVESATFSSERDFVVVGLKNGTIQVWNTSTGQHIHTLRGHTDYVRMVAFSPDGKQIVSGSDDKTVCIWNVQSEKLVHPPLQHTHGVSSVAFSPDSNWVVSGSADIYLWDTTAGTLVHEPLRGRPYGISDVAFSQNGKWIASGDETVQLWDAESGQPIGSPLPAHTSFVIALAISPDSKFVVSGSVDGVIHLWDTTERALCTTFHGHMTAVGSVAFSGDGQYIVSGSYDNTVRVWNTSTRRTEKNIVRRHAGLGSGMAISPDGERIVTWQLKGICVWDVSMGMPVQGQHWPEHTAGILYITFLPDGRRVLSWSEDGNVCVWEVSTGQQIRQFQVPTSGSSRLFSGAISPDGRYIALSRLERIIHVWDITTGERSQEPLKRHTGYVASLAFSPDGKRIASGAWDNTIRLWDVETRPSGNAPSGKVLHIGIHSS